MFKWISLIGAVIEALAIAFSAESQPKGREIAGQRDRKVIGST